ncbi:MAG: heliorhodopsin HeR [Candidatus Dojkabacteria bacterium]|nr:heliorhodopsin HeR [Candidatus Dojkabacteria bacterium]
MDKYKNLRIWNISMGFLHLIQSILMIVLSNDFSLPIMTNYLQFDIQTQSILPSPEILVEVKLGYLIAGFLLMSSIAHFVISLPKVYEWYVKNLKKGINYARWIEYTFSSSLMIVAIAMLVGVYDLSSLILMFGVNAMMILFGMVMEVHNQDTEKTNWLSYYFGCIAGAIPWVVIALYLFGSGEGDYKAPDFVYWIFFSIFLFFNSFAVNMILQYKKVGKWKDYVFGEKVYIIMSLVAKSLLAWQVFAGTLRPV